MDITGIDIKPTLVLTKGKWYVCVTIPADYRAAFKGQKQLKVSTGTSDRSLAEKFLISKSNKLIAKIRAASDAQHPLVEAAQKVIDKQFKDAKTEDDKWIAEAQKAGMEYIVPTAEQKLAWVKRVRSEVWPIAEESLGKELMDKIRAKASLPK